MYRNERPFYLQWDELPLDWREEKVEEVRNKLVEQGKEDYEYEYEGNEEDYEDLAEFVREEIWSYDAVVEHIENHFPIYF